MADQRPNPQAPTLPALPPEPRRSGSKGVDGERSNSNIGRTIQSAPVKAESSGPNVRRDGGSGGREVKAASPQRDRELPKPSAPSDNPFTSNSPILETIAARFNKAREDNRAGAWRQLQTDLMNASPFICPVIIPYKDLISIVSDIEKEIKGTSASQVGKSNEELLSNFLSGGSMISVDKGVTVSKGDGEHIVSTPTDTVNLPSV